MVKRVLAFGTFDHLHPGHLSYLKQAKALGGQLLVLVACNQAVRWAKGRAPAQSEAARLAAVRARPEVDEAWLGEPVTALADYLKPIKAKRPAVIALGYDQAAQHEAWLKAAVKNLKPRPKIIRLKAFQPAKYKSSLLKNSP